MSGPKSSSYTLTAAMRRQIEAEQRRKREAEEERRRIVSAKQRKGELCAELSRQISNLEAQADRLHVLQKESGKTVPELAEYQSTIEQQKKALGALQAVTPETSKEFHKQNEDISTMLRTAVSVSSACADTLTQVSAEFKKELNKSIAEGYHLSFSHLGEKNIKLSAQIQQQIHRINDALSEICSLPMSNQLKEHLSVIHQKAEEISDPSFLGNFYAVVVQPFIKECKLYAGLCEEHDELLIRYTILASECFVEPRPVPYTQDGIQFLKEEIALLEEKSREQREREYIREALDAAMVEMGYELVGDRIVSKRSGKKIRHGLYSLENGTAVDVTYADNGQITMELGGIDTQDRQPDAEESEQLVEDMRRFCGDYDKLIQILAERGIRSEKITRLPPSAEYAQIFNSTSYHMKKTVERYTAVTRKKASKQVLRRE